MRYLRFAPTANRPFFDYLSHMIPETVRDSNPSTTVPFRGGRQ